MRSPLKSRTPSLRKRLQAVFIAGVALSAGLVMLMFILLEGPLGRIALSCGIQDYADGIARHLRFDANGRPVGMDETKVERWLFDSLGEEIGLRVLDERGTPQFAMGGTDHLHALTPAGEPFDTRRRTFAYDRAGIAMHAAIAARSHDGRRWYVQLAISDRLVLQMRDAFGDTALRQGVAATCVTFLVIFLITMHFTLRRALDPLRIASSAAQRITPRSLDARLDAQAQPHEIRPLVNAFNDALGRLEHGFRTQQEFLAHAAHELKTPLALIRAQVELGPATPANRLLIDDVDRMARQVQQLLMLAEVSEPRNYRIERIDPRATVQEVFQFMSRVADRREVHLGLMVDDALRSWDVDRGALFTLMKNLLENAIQHSPAGGVVSLTVTSAGFSVEDQGPGVTAQDLPRIFDRFWRGKDRQDEGAGLGLAICMEITQAHGWALDARCAAPGHGLTMVARLGGRSASAWRPPARPTGADRIGGSGARAMRAALF
ncbi:MAG: ATP-binding protein [Burkholderiaceae bacterium]